MTDNTSLTQRSLHMFPPAGVEISNMMGFRLHWFLLAISSGFATALINDCIANAGGLTEIVGRKAAPQSDVCEFLGIPYASPPVGPLRFAPPVPLHKSSSPGAASSFSADQYGYDCPQNTASYFAYPNATAQYRNVYAAFVNQLNNTQSEDCLTLNVWSKGGDPAAEEKKPVIVFIYGGRFSAGTSNTPFYRGDLLADAQDVVVVTFNFRMNIFGTPIITDLFGHSDGKCLGFQRLFIEFV